MSPTHDCADAPVAEESERKAAATTHRIVLKIIE
jgi:hypothetical protein